MSTHLRDQQKAQLCQTLLAVPASAPTLCQGWDAHDLAVHLWVLKKDPRSWPGMVIPALAGTTRRRAQALKRRWSYAALVDDLRQQSGPIACMPLDRREGHRHALGEYYIHTEDIRRANGLPVRTLSSELEDALWTRARAAGRQLWTPSCDAVQFAAAGRDPFILGKGHPHTLVKGPPSEAILWIYGRKTAANVTVTHKP